MGTTAPPSFRIAICDDVAEFRRVLELLLEVEHDFTIVGQASNGREAIELVTKVDVDVLLLDVAMPIMDGMEALPHVVEASPATSVIMLTGFGTAAKRRRAKELGAAGYVEKGLAPNALIDAIRLESQKQAARTRS